MNQYIAVAEIDSGEVLYCGTSESAAAQWLEPGHVYAVHETATIAWENAKALARDFRDRGYEPPFMPPACD